VSSFIRRSHRWISMAFMAAVIANFVAMAFGPPPVWITYAPLLPLFLLMGSGIYLLALPWFGKHPRQIAVRES